MDEIWWFVMLVAVGCLCYALYFKCIKWFEKI